jgi:hypothetical protein
MLKYIKLGNSKIAASVARIDLPTSVCGSSCPKCYAKKAEVMYSNTRTYRQRCLDLANSKDFVATIDAEIKEAWPRAFRFHCAGDFYSQEYVDKCTEIMARNLEVKFFHWTKVYEKFDFSKMDSLGNVNTMNSHTPLGLNYGSDEFIGELRDKHGYFICPDAGTHDVCFRSCKMCLTEKKVCFKIH